MPLQHPDLTKLPKWAQTEIARLKTELAAMTSAKDTLREQCLDYEKRQGGPAVIALEPWRGFDNRSRPQIFPIESTIELRFRGEKQRGIVQICADGDSHAMRVTSNSARLVVLPSAGNAVLITTVDALEGKIDG